MKVTLELSDLVVMQYKHAVSHIFHKILATDRLVSKTLIKYNSNISEENEEDEKEPIDIEFTEQKAGLEIMKMIFTLDDWMYKMKTRKMSLWLTSLKNYKSKLMREIFQKSY